MLFVLSQHIECSEIVLGLITTVGTDMVSLISSFEDQFRLFSYSVEVINVSKVILKQFLDIPEPQDEYQRIVKYMDLGDDVRLKTKDNAILMRGVASQIYSMREKDSYGAQPRERIAYIVKSIKHPDEVDCLREIYGDGFYAIGVTSPESERIKHLINDKGLNEVNAHNLIKRDEDSVVSFGQHTRDAFQKADYFLSITGNNSEMKSNVIRLVELLFGNPYLTPTFDEYAMFMAYANSLRSADLSRQIGAVVTKNNEIIASGVNDCAKPGGGLYWPDKREDGTYFDELGGRDFTLREDSNKIEQRRLIDKIINEFQKEFKVGNGKGEVVADESILDKIRNRLKKTGIGSLTEYGRVVHAEMEALSMCARNMISSKGTTMYVTTFPCHNCAKHIIAAGVSKVYYIEPYPKSKALDFYQKQITTEETEDESKVKFLPFCGVGPRRFADLFSMDSHRWQKRERKNDEGEAIDWDKSKASLRTPMPITIYLDNENKEYSTFYEGIKVINEGAK